MATDTRHVLKVLLRIGAVVCLSAALAVVMPRSWMALCHRWLGLGELPNGVIVDYLARSESALYAMFGGMLWMLASDVERHARLIHYWACALITFGVVMLFVDLSIGMPLHWTLMEGPWLVVMGGVLLWLERRIRADKSFT